MGPWPGCTHSHSHSHIQIVHTYRVLFVESRKGINGINQSTLCQHTFQLGNQGEAAFGLHREKGVRCYC